jgi:cytoplasmic iron level regulating protein YaaA (DUF328/UPF0246 family)
MPPCMLVTTRRAVCLMNSNIFLLLAVLLVLHHQICMATAFTAALRSRGSVAHHRQLVTTHNRLVGRTHTKTRFIWNNIMDTSNRKGKKRGAATSSNTDSDSAANANDATTNTTPVHKSSGHTQCKIMMILSPAKTLDLKPLNHNNNHHEHEQELDVTTSLPSCDLDKTRHIAKIMKGMSRSDLKKLLSISDNLAATAHGYWADFNVDLLVSVSSTKHNDNDNTDTLKLKPAIFSFNGPAFQGLNVATMTQPTLDYLQSSLRIVDPLYGVLKPLDAFQPYRLEMAAKNISDTTGKDLAKYWKESVTASLSKELLADTDPSSNGSKKHGLVLNLASDEYSSAVDPISLCLPLPDDKTRTTVTWVKVVFQQEGKVVSVHAKRARGLMARYVADCRAASLEDVKQFNVEGYSLVTTKSSSDDNSTLTLIFDRKKQPKPAPAPAKVKAPSKAKAKTAVASAKKSATAASAKSKSSHTTMAGGNNTNNNKNKGRPDAVAETVDKKLRRSKRNQ